MNLATYLLIQAELADTARRLRHFQLDEFIAAAEHAETVGPIVHPTLYAKAGARLSDVLCLARAAKAFRDATKDLDEAWLTGIANVEP